MPVKTHLQNRPKELTKAKVRILLSEIAQAFEKPIQPKTHHDFSHQKQERPGDAAFIGFMKSRLVF